MASGIFTAGQHRESTLNIILDNDLSNKSILDVGCAYGYFSFEAEKRGAKVVVGTELKTARFMGANIIKEIKGSNVTFINRDVCIESMDQSFDIVLLLNVLHHLKYPLYSLKVLSELCKEKMILEYPVISDTKFQATLDTPLHDDNLPFIGVSSIKKNDQTFLFNDEALRRILTDHNQFFKDIEIMESPYQKNRHIAICYK